jgi:hypothetical protein
MKVSTEIDNNFGYEKITQLVDNIPLREFGKFCTCSLDPENILLFQNEWRKLD